LGKKIIQSLLKQALNFDYCEIFYLFFELVGIVFVGGFKHYDRWLFKNVSGHTGSGFEDSFHGTKGKHSFHCGFVTQ
jgi:hypothetical protein